MRWLRDDRPIGTALTDALGEARAVREVAALLLRPDPEERPAAKDLRDAGLHAGLLGLHGSARTVVAAYLARQAALSGRSPLVYLTADDTSLDEVREDFHFLLGRDQVAHFPDLGVDAYSQQIPHARIQAARVETLARLVTRPDGVGPAGNGQDANGPRQKEGARGEPDQNDREAGSAAAAWFAHRPAVLITTPHALFQRIPAPAHFSRFLTTLRLGQRIEIEELLAFLVRLGFQRQVLVGEYGDFSRRGGIVDVYSFGCENPVRIEFDDDEIVALREFDVATQRSLRVQSAMPLLPLTEVIIDEGDWERFEQSGLRPPQGSLREHLDMLRGEGSFDGLEWMLTRFGVPLGSLLDYAGPEALVVAEDPLLLERQLEEARREVLEHVPTSLAERILREHAGAGAAPASADEDDSVIVDFTGDPDEDFELLATLFSGPAELFDLEGSLSDLLARRPSLYVGIGLAQSALDREPAEKGETKARHSRWTAGEQIHGIDPLEFDPRGKRGSAQWRQMLAESIRRRSRQEDQRHDRRTRRAGPPSSDARDVRGAGDARDAGGVRGGGSVRGAGGVSEDPDAQAERIAREAALAGWGPDEEAGDEGIDPTLLEAEMEWADHAEASSLLGYTPRHFTLKTKAQEHFGRNLELVRGYIRDLMGRGLSVTVLCDTSNHRERLEELMDDVGATFVVGNLAAGFEVPELEVAVLTDHEIFERMRRRKAGRRYSRGISLKELLAMRPGDFVVHIEHGIGVYRGIGRLTVNGHLTDCMKIEYAKGDKLFIPVDQLNLVQKYAAEEGATPALSRLGTNQWAKTKARVKQSIKEMAGELIKLYAARKAQLGYAFPPDNVWQMEMEARFPYEETPDQLSSIQDVKADMERPSPMERLICGDVGYGKTEVAIRAAFKAVTDGKQVGFLVPTTLLTQQHFDTFTERLRGYPMRVDMLSRFRTRKEIKATLADLAAGKVDIIVGTHRLLSKDVRFKDLGLVIIDEEQRFGVAHKERLKQMRTQVDVLTLTATPIPRTLNMALLGVRDMSTIRTPPRDRRPIKTEIAEFGDEVITYALMHEADRGGQSFFVHNRVETIDAMANYIRSLVPHLRVAVGHGQMRERQLEDVMRKFLAGEYDVLVATMIIESGLDLPNVNTILVNRTDSFGLAQLYQLRGRVGRSARRAYAYLLLPPDRVMTETAMKRLKAMEEFEDLGSGFQLAMRDLEIRGAGNILGTEQHGFIANVGFEMYQRLLEEAAKELKGIPAPKVIEARVVTDLEAFLPRSYVSDDPEKMNIYKTLADAATIGQVDELAAEVADRFGRPPAQAEALFEFRRLRIRATRASVDTLILRDGAVALDLRRPLSRDQVQRLIQQMPIPVSFKTHGQHRVDAAAREVGGEMLLVAGQILDCLLEEDAESPEPAVST